MSEFKKKYIVIKNNRDFSFLFKKGESIVTFGKEIARTDRYSYEMKRNTAAEGFLFLLSFFAKSSTDFLIIFSNLRKCWKGLLYQAFPAFCVSEDTPHIMAFRSLTWR